MDWNFPDGVDVMLQLTGESAYCSGRRNPSGDSTCPVLILWKTSPIVDSLFTSSTPRSRSTLIPTQTCTKTSILIRQCRLACGPETEIKFVWPNLINKLFKGTHVQHTESLPMNTLAPPNSTLLYTNWHKNKSDISYLKTSWTFKHSNPLKSSPGSHFQLVSSSV